MLLILQATLSDILRQLGKAHMSSYFMNYIKFCFVVLTPHCLKWLKLGSHFGVDLMHRKAEVKAIITDVINNMSDEEDDEGDEAGSGDDAEKDEDGDDDA